MAVGSTRAMVTWSSNFAPKAAKHSRYLSGNRSKEGPVSKRCPSRPVLPNSSDRIRPPSVSFFSSSVTLKPARAKRPAKARPPTPAPTTTAVLPFGIGLAPPSGAGKEPLLATAAEGTAGSAPKRLCDCAAAAPKLTERPPFCCLLRRCRRAAASCSAATAATAKAAEGADEATSFETSATAGLGAEARMAWADAELEVLPNTCGWPMAGMLPTKKAVFVGGAIARAHTRGKAAGQR
mmetsp:Transcript_66958/g.189300  ORF Transcript_66958/g.189300 Transcript_66958/m.189300 type:complete len:237 (-) Transcript_66958:14-724(-)